MWQLQNSSLQYQYKASRQVIRIKKNVNKGIISWSNTKFSKLTSKKLYGRQWGELLMRSWELKVNVHISCGRTLLDHYGSEKS